ncbi:hypothetical protein B0H13DRAFT_2493818 [Mycena leptocephala]|nr:hypothetical protein B0H13DRAFT_2493818 [Mycena leptocephala]
MQPVIYVTSCVRWHHSSHCGGHVNEVSPSLTRVFLHLLLLTGNNVESNHKPVQSCVTPSSVHWGSISVPSKLSSSQGLPPDLARADLTSQSALNPSIKKTKELETPTLGPVLSANQQGQGGDIQAENGSVKNAQAEPPLTELPPWVEFKVDQNLTLNDIHEWNQQNPNNKFSTLVLGRVTAILESKVVQAGIKLVPDNPVPAQSLVSALVSLALLGTKIPAAKQEVSGFAKEVATDISLLADVFGGPSNSSPLLEVAWDDLQKTRDLVNEICEWANVELAIHYGQQRKKWSNAPGLYKDIEDWHAKLDRARSKFSQHTLIHILKSVATTTQSVDDIKHGLQNMAPHLAELHKDREIEKVLQSIQATLGKRIVPSAKYDAKEQREREYIVNTRLDILEEIMTWTNLKSNTENCLWITGKVYVGKSTIAAHLAEKLGDEKSLYAQFFIARAIDSTTDPDSIFPTMAWQLAERSPLAAVLIKKNLDSVPSHASRLSKEQASALFLEPLQVIAQYAGKVVIILDGVDELVKLREFPTFTLSKVTSILCDIVHDLPPQVKVLILSRPEQPILQNIPSGIKQLELPVEQSISDMEKILDQKLKTLVNTYKLTNWPSAAQRKQLCDLAAGHLGWTQLVIAWITQQLEQTAQKQIRAQQLFEELQAAPLVAGDLESLYQLILTRITPPLPPNREEFLMGFAIIVGALAVLQEPLDISTLRGLVLLDLESSGLHYLDLVDFLDEMSSVFLDGTDSMSKTTTKELDQFLPDINNFMKNSFLQWLEVLSLEKEVSSAVPTLQAMEKHLQDPSLLLLIQDAIKFVEKFEVPIQTSAPHIYISALPQAPTDSLIYQQYLHQFPQLPCMKEGAESWDGVPTKVRYASLSSKGTHLVATFSDKTLRVFNLPKGEVSHTQFMVDAWAVAISSNGRLVTTVARGALCLWEVGEGQEMKRFQLDVGDHEPDSIPDEDPDTAPEKYVPLSLSPNEICIALLVAGCGASIHVWDLSSPQDSMKVVGYHMNKGVTSVVFFPDGKQIMSTSQDGTIRVWDGEELAEIEYFYDGDGQWILGNDEELLCWTLSGVRHPRNNLIIGPHVDLTHSVHGEQWLNCKQPAAIADS